MVDDFVPPEVVHERMERLTEVVEAPRAAQDTRRASGPSEEVLVDGPSKKDPRCGRAAAATTSSSTSRHPTVRRFAPGEYVDVRVTHAAPHWLRGDFVRRVRPARRRGVRIPVAVSPA